MRIKTFFDTEMRLFSIYDNERSLPHAIDGFKPSQRKIIFGMLKRGETAPELRVEAAANHIAACLAPETKILLASGEMIEVCELEAKFTSGELTSVEVLSFNEETQTIVIDTCSAAFITKQTSELLEIYLEDGNKIRLTEDHRVLTKNGWKEAKYLDENDEIVSY